MTHILWLDFKEDQLPSKKFTHLWQKDLDYLSTLKGFPKWNEIQSASFVSGNHLARSLLLQANLPRQLVDVQNRSKIVFSKSSASSNRFKLEVVLVSWKDANKTGTVVQYELLDGKTKNKLWEFSRTLIF